MSLPNGLVKPAVHPPPTSFPTYPDLSGKVALITGIGQTGTTSTTTWGNGAATARVLAANGVKIFGCDLNLAAAEHTKSRILKLELNAVVDVVKCDVTSQSSVEAFVQAAVDRHGRIDILFNNVGGLRSGSAGDMDEKTWMGQMDLNVNSVYRCCHAVLPIMEAQASGSIVNNASITALRYIGKPQIAYATAKAAVVRFTKTSGVEYAGKGIRFNCVVPGLIYTPLIENYGLSDKEEDHEVFRRVTENSCPDGKMGDSFDVANIVVFLASDAARYVNAHALVVDGGITEQSI